MLKGGIINAMSFWQLLMHLQKVYWKHLENWLFVSLNFSVVTFSVNVQKVHQNKCVFTKSWAKSSVQCQFKNILGFI